LSPESLKERICAALKAQFDVARPSEDILTHYITDGIGAAYNRLSVAIQVIENDYDFILIDCPPGYSFVTNSALLAANCVIVPLDSGHMSYTGAFSATLYFAKLAKTLSIPPIRVLGYLLCRYSQTRSLPKEVDEELAINFPGQTFESRVRESTEFAKAMSEARSLWHGSRRGKSVVADYECLVEEILERMNLIADNSKTPSDHD
jgi:chromosome partitioning protein